MDRPLGVFEHLLWLFNEASPLHAAMSVRVNARIETAALERAVQNVQARHPTLRAAIRPDASGRPHFVSVPEARIPLRIVERADGFDVRGVLQAELDQPFESRVAPLARVALLRDSATSELIVSMHHSAGDGISAVIFLRDVLQHLATGRDLERLPPRAAMETLFGFDEGEVPPPPVPTERHKLPGVVHLTRELDVAVAQPFFARCRSEKTTVQSAVLAALFFAMRDTLPVPPSGEFGCSTPINTRPLCPAVLDDIGNFLSGCVVRYRPESSSRFWDVARSARQQIEAGLLPEAFRARCALQRTILLNYGKSNAAPQLPYQMIASNLGRFPETPVNSALRVQGMVICINVTPVMPIVIFGSASDRLCVNGSSATSLDGIIDAAIAHLRAATG